MYPVSVVFLNGTVAIGGRKTYYPPQKDDHIEMAGKDPQQPDVWKVVNRRWKLNLTTTNETLEVIVTPLRIAGDKE